MPDPTDPSDQPRLFGDDQPLTAVEVVEETVLLTWGSRGSNRFGPKPPTFRRIRRTIVAETTERWCPRCSRYLSLEDGFAGKGRKCRDCVRAEHLKRLSDPMTRERQRWSGSRHRVIGLGIADEVTFEQWLAVLDAADWKCAIPGCGRDYHSMDHIEALGVGGPHTPENLQPLCDEHHYDKTRCERFGRPWIPTPTPTVTVYSSHSGKPRKKGRGFSERPEGQMAKAMRGQTA